MKKNLFAPALTLALCLLLAACAGPASAVPSPPGSNPASAPQSTAASLPGPSSAPEAPAPMDEAVAKSMFLGLYEKGYTQFIGIYWGAFTDYGTSIDVEGTTYYLFTAYTTRAEMEADLGQYFTGTFVQRNIAPLFEGTEFLKMLERDGALYISEGGGLGGSAELYTREFAAESISGTEWAFTLFDYDYREDAPIEDMTWRFAVVYGENAWRIDSIVVEFSDGQGGTDGYSY